MDVQELLLQARQTVSAQRSYAEPYEKNGVTVIPASSVRGGGGGGADREGDGGGGFGVIARPAGAWVIKGDQVTWKPAVDPTRFLVGAEILMGLRILNRRRARRPRLLGRRRRHSLRLRPGPAPRELHRAARKRLHRS